MKKTTLIASLIGVGAVAALAGVMVCKKLSEKKKDYHPCGCKKDLKANTPEENLDIQETEDISSELLSDEDKETIEETSENKEEVSPEEPTPEI